MTTGEKRSSDRSEYQEFLAKKRITAPIVGFDVSEEEINPTLKPFQRDVVRWALRRGRAALFLDTGLGKTFCSLDWARHVCKHVTNSKHFEGRVLILTPLGVTKQFVREGEKFGYVVTKVRSQSEVKAGISVTNYESLHKFDTKEFDGVVCDESSILKSYTGATKRQLCDMWHDTPFKLCGTATPAPNDHMELGNHSEFLNVMAGTEMFMRFFINDTMKAGGYRLKKHAEKDFWRWVATWAACVTKPSDLGYSDEGYILPPLNIIRHVVEVDQSRALESGQLFIDGSISATTLHKEKRATNHDRAAKMAELIGDSDSPWFILCNTNYEADAIKAVIPDAVEVRGNDSIESKEDRLSGFAEGTVNRLLTKGSIAGWGLNYQHCQNIALYHNFSYEELYQIIRRCWRFGQQHPVNVHIVAAESEGDIMAAIQRKQEQHEEMKAKMSEAMRESDLTTKAPLEMNLNTERETLTEGDWSLLLGDCCERIKDIEDNSVGLSVHSPPFSNLYTYSDSLQDMGNCANDAEFMQHYLFLIEELHRVTMPGRIACVHCKDLPLYANRDGAAGLRDFPGDIIRAFVSKGWTFHSRVTIWKDPVIEMQRTKNHGLLYKNFRERGECLRQGMADYMLMFRKWDGVEGTESPEPVKHPDTELMEYVGENVPEKGNFKYEDRGEHYDANLQLWQQYASPIWMDIQQTDVLNKEMAKESDDERHIAPLQLGVIERCIQLWSNKGDLVLDPFNGIGSSGVVAIRLGRRYVGIELKHSYYSVAARYLRNAVIEAGQTTMEMEFATA
jgi:DNA modification methylase